MKKFIIAAVLAVMSAGVQCSAQGVDFKSILSGLAGSSSDSTAQAKGSGAGKIGSLLGNLLSSDKLTVSSITGDWKYVSPAVSFKSDNLLKKAGGAAAASAVEAKLAPYYKTAGFEQLALTIAADSTFTMKLRRTTLKGTIETVTDPKSDANFIFNFKVAGKVNIGKMNTYVVKNGTNSVKIMFDVSRLVTLIEKVGSVTGNSTISGVSKLLNGYDGICAGFELKK